ncbi:MAG: dipeptidase [Patescibacteria group bacterium]|nr:dipeptidase [Patescibacteria group bacterium]
MKLLLTSNGLSNNSIANALSELIGKKPSDSKIAFIPTAAICDRGDKYWLIDDLYRIKEYGYHVDIIEISALTTESIKDALNDSDAIFIGGGNPFYLSYWMQKKGIFELLPNLLITKVYAGISAGSMIAGNGFQLSSKALKRDILEESDYDDIGPIGESSAKTLNFVNFIFKPHLNSMHHVDERSEDYVRKIAEKTNKLIYTLDDQSALKIVDDKIEVVSEGEWLLLNKG